MEMSPEVENLYELSRKELLELLRECPTKLDRFYSSDFPHELMDFRPEVEDAWTIREHLVHVFDAEVGCYIFIRKAIVEPGSATMWYTGANWAEPLKYSDQLLDQDTLIALKKVRSLTYEKLKSMEYQDWSEYYVKGSEDEKVDLDFFLKILAPHVDWHLEYIDRNEELWRSQNR